MVERALQETSVKVLIDNISVLSPVDLRYKQVRLASQYFDIYDKIPWASSAIAATRASASPFCRPALYRLVSDQSLTAR